MLLSRLHSTNPFGTIRLGTSLMLVLGMRFKLGKASISAFYVRGSQTFEVCETSKVSFGAASRKLNWSNGQKAVSKLGRDVKSCWLAFIYYTQTFEVCKTSKVFFKRVPTLKRAPFGPVATHFLKIAV